MNKEKREVLTKESCVEKLKHPKGMFIGMAVVFALLTPAVIALGVAAFRELSRFFGERTIEEVDLLDMIYVLPLGLVMLLLFGSPLFFAYAFYQMFRIDRQLKRGEFLIVSDELIRFSEEIHYRRSSSRSGIEVQYFAHFAKTGKYHCGESFQNRYSVGDLFYVVVLDGKYIEPYKVYSQDGYVCYEVDDLYE